MFTRIGIHELKHTPDDLLLKLNPQVIVTVGTYEHADAINKHLARVRHLKALLPNALVAVRWWKDDNILDRFSPIEYAQSFFPLHVPGTLLMVGNEDNPNIFADTVRKHIEVMRLATDAGVAIGTCCTSTGNPRRDQYDLLAPLFVAMHEARLRGVVHWWRPNAYFVPGDSNAMRDHLLRHYDEGLRAARLAGVPMPPMFLGELGAVKAYTEPEAGYRMISNFGENEYTNYLLSNPLPFPAALYCWGVGVYDERWQHFAASEGLIRQFAARLPRTSKSAYEEWREPAMSLTEGVITSTKANVVNVRRTASTQSTVLWELRVGSTVRYDPTIFEGGAYRVGGNTVNTWYALDEGYVAAGVVTIETVGDTPDHPIRKLDVPFVSQLGPDANRTNNDCGIACVLMLIQFCLKAAGLRPMKALTVDRLIEDTPLALADKPQGLTVLTGLLDTYGVDAQITRPLTPDAIIKQIDARKPVLALVNYQQIGGEAFGHYVVVHGYGERGFYLHDPYHKGSDTYVSRESLDEALTNTSGFAAFPYQGVTLS